MCTADDTVGERRVRGIGRVERSVCLCPAIEGRATAAGRQVDEFAMHSSVNMNTK